jgi:hypothetical protein
LFFASRYTLKSTICGWTLAEFNSEIRLRKFHLTNLLFDRYHLKMRLSHILLSRLNLFPAYNQFTVVHINGELQGVYLLVENPEKAILRTHQNIAGVYRRTMHGFDTKYEAPQVADQSHIQGLVEIMSKLKGPQRVAALDLSMDIDAYLTWLAFNSAFKNADSVDEIFYYVVISDQYPKGRIELMAWDCDDILAQGPSHPRRVVKHPLFFGCENKLDRIIISDPILLNRYKVILNRLLNADLSPSSVMSCFNSVKNELDCIESELIPNPEFRETDKREKFIQFFFERYAKRRLELLDILRKDQI